MEVADVHSAFESHALEYTNISSMDIHPNKEGHSAIYSLLSGLTAEQTSAPVTGAVTAEADGSESAVETPAGTPAKGSPDTGVGGAAAFAGIAALAAAGVFACRKRK